MTSTVADDESVIEGLQRSVFHLNEEKNKAANKKNVLHRMVFASKLKEESIPHDDIIDHYEETFKEMATFYGAELISGLLLVYPRHVVHVLESSLEMLLLVIRKFNDVAGASILERTRLLMITHDINQRLFCNWNGRVLDVEPANIELYEPNDTEEHMIEDVCVQLLKLGVHLAKEPNKFKIEDEQNTRIRRASMITLAMKLNQALDAIRDQVPHLVPDQQIIGYLSSVVEDSAVMHTLEDFLQLYDSPYDTRLARATTWPMPARMFPYN